MDGEAPAKPGEQKVTNPRAGWKMPFLLFLCLLQAANALKGPRLVSGEPGGAVTIQCKYGPLLISSHQRKYWCRLNPSTGLCHTIVSTNRYTRPYYHGRVALEDFPKKGLFVVRLCQLSPEDVGYYRCGIGNNNNLLFFSMNLTVSAGLSKTIPTATPAAGVAPKLTTGPFGRASAAANICMSGTIQTLEAQETEWNRVVLTLGTIETSATVQERQTAGATVTVAPGTGGQVEVSIWATVPTPQSPASTIRGEFQTTGDVQVWGSTSSEAKKATASERESGTATASASWQSEETEWVRLASDTAGKVIGTTRPSTLVSEKWMWETPREKLSVAKPQALGSKKGPDPAAAVWTLELTSMEMASAEGSSEGDLDTPAGDSGPPMTPSQALAAGPLRPLGEDSSVKSSSQEEKTLSRILTPLSTVLCPLMLTTLVLLQRKLRRKSSCEWGFSFLEAGGGEGLFPSHTLRTGWGPSSSQGFKG
uniref:Immunoglobulin domain-containing protein n=1 Tax=Sus scrofa TaxID=9823 RepID=A0A8D1VX01_PIG